jgi:hypothetical protein
MKAYLSYFLQQAQANARKAAAPGSSTAEVACISTTANASTKKFKPTRSHHQKQQHVRPDQALEEQHKHQQSLP